jgi:hypothetical protein
MTLAEQVSRELVANTRVHQVQAKELAKCDEEVAAAATEPSMTSKGSAPVFLALGIIDHETID